MDQDPKNIRIRQIPQHNTNLLLKFSFFSSKNGVIIFCPPHSNLGDEWKDAGVEPGARRDQSPGPAAGGGEGAQGAAGGSSFGTQVRPTSALKDPKHEISDRSFDFFTSSKPAWDVNSGEKMVFYDPDFG